MFIEPTDLLSATEVGGLQSNLGFRGTDPGAYLFDVPTVVMLRLRDLSGQPIGKAEVEVYPMAGGKIDTSSPPAKLTTSEDGVALLPKRPTQAPENYSSPSGHKAIDSLFGRIDPLGSNSALLVKAAKNGTTDHGYLKVWQFVDAYRRSGVGVAFLELRLNLGSASDVENYAASGLLSDSANGLPAQLHALVDGDPTTAHRLPGEGVGCKSTSAGTARLPKSNSSRLPTALGVVRHRYVRDGPASHRGAGLGDGARFLVDAGQSVPLGAERRTRDLLPSEGEKVPIPSDFEPGANRANWPKSVRLGLKFEVTARSKAPAPL